MTNLPRTGVVYALTCNCDETGEDVRYVGMTVRGAAKRLAHHIKDALNPNSPRRTHHKNQWIRAHLGRGHAIITTVLETATRDELPSAERRWIERGQELGWRLTNAQCADWTYAADETRAKISAARLKYFESPENRDAYAAVRKEVANRPEVRAALSAARAAWWKDEARRREGAERVTRQWKDPEVRARQTARIREALSDPLHTERRRRARYEALHRRWHVNRGIVKPDCEFC